MEVPSIQFLHYELEGRVFKSIGASWITSLCFETGCFRGRRLFVVGEEFCHWFARLEKPRLRSHKDEIGTNFCSDWLLPWPCYILFILYEMAKKRKNKSANKGNNLTYQRKITIINWIQFPFLTLFHIRFPTQDLSSRKTIGNGKVCGTLLVWGDKYE